MVVTIFEEAGFGGEDWTRVGCCSLSKGTLLGHSGVAHLEWLWTLTGDLGSVFACGLQLECWLEKRKEGAKPNAAHDMEMVAGLGIWALSLALLTPKGEFASMDHFYSFAGVFPGLLSGILLDLRMRWDCSNVELWGPEFESLWFMVVTKSPPGIVTILLVSTTLLGEIV